MPASFTVTSNCLWLMSITTWSALSKRSNAAFDWSSFVPMQSSTASACFPFCSRSRIFESSVS